MLNRYRDYPRYLNELIKREPFDIYHVIDHSYAQLVHVLPAERTMVTCHDLDTFRCLLQPELEPRPRWFRALARRTLRGLQQAAAVACDSQATHDAVREHDLIPEDRLHVILNGVHPEFLEPPDPAAEAEVDRMLGPADPSAPPDVLHVGTTIPRKRIDDLLDIFAGIRREFPGAADQGRRHLHPSPAQAATTSGSKTPSASCRFSTTAGPLPPSTAAPRWCSSRARPRASAFRWSRPWRPAPLLVSDLPVLREVAGEAAVYRKVGDIDSWVSAAVGLLHDQAQRSDAWRDCRERGFARSALYRWDAHAARLAVVYRQLLMPSATR